MAASSDSDILVYTSRYRLVRTHGDWEIQESLSVRGKNGTVLIELNWTPIQAFPLYEKAAAVGALTKYALQGCEVDYGGYV